MNCDRVLESFKIRRRLRHDKMSFDHVRGNPRHGRPSDGAKALEGHGRRTIHTAAFVSPGVYRDEQAVFYERDRLDHLFSEPICETRPRKILFCRLRPAAVQEHPGEAQRKQICAESSALAQAGGDGGRCGDGGGQRSAFPGTAVSGKGQGLCHGGGHLSVLRRPPSPLYRDPEDGGGKLAPLPAETGAVP